MAAKIEMPLDEYQAIERARDIAQAEVAKLKEQLLDAKLNAPVTEGDTTVLDLVKLTRELLKVACYAVGQTPVETNRCWPLDALERAANLLMMLPDIDTNDQAIMIAFRDFVTEGRRIEKYRAERDS